MANIRLSQIVDGTTVSNVVLDEDFLAHASNDISYGPHIFTYLGEVPIDLTDEQLYEPTGTINYFIAEKDGSFVHHQGSFSDDVVAGTANAILSVNGTGVSSSLLDLDFDNIDSNDLYASVPEQTVDLTFVAGDKLGIQLTTDSSFDSNEASYRGSFAVIYNE